MIWFIIRLLIAYVVGQAVYIYNSDAKIRAKCKAKSWLDAIGILLITVWEKHKFWYKDSDLEDIVDEARANGVDLAKQAKAQAVEAVSELEDKAHEVVANAKAQVTKATKKTAAAKKSTAKKAPAKVNKAAPKGKTTAKKK